jgi:hypothetical protein
MMDKSLALPQKRPRPKAQLLSFMSDSGEDAPPPSKRPLGKNPDANTEFLPDPEADRELQKERDRISEIYENEQTLVKSKSQIVRPGHPNRLRILGRHQQSLYIGLPQVNLSRAVLNPSD